MTSISVAGFPESEEIVSGEPQDDPGLELSADAATPVAQPKMQGPWLEDEREKVAKDIDKKWTAQDKGMKTRLARWDVNTRRRDGDPYSKLVKDTDEDTFKVYTPRGIEQAPPALNKTDDLCVKVVANLLVDPPKPECEPASDSDEDRSSAEFSTRVLMNESTESGFNIPDHVRVAEDLACAHASGFVYAYLDPHGGGHRPKEIMASKAATTVDDALFTLQPDPSAQPGSFGAESIPDGGMEAMQAPEPTMVKVPQPTPYVIRYVAEDGKTLTDDPSKAEREWLPKVCGEDITGKQLRFLPETCTGIRDADGVLIAAISTLGSLKARFPDVAKMRAEDLQKLVSYAPAIKKTLLPKFAGSGEGTKPDGWRAEDGPPDDALVLTITGYQRGSLTYPLGAYVVMGGKQFVLHRQEWKEEIPSSRSGAMVPRAMDIPVAQFRQFRDTKAQDPYGRGLVDLVGDGDPLVAFIDGAAVEYLHRVNNPHLFVPIGSGIQAKSLNLPRGTPIPFNPAGGGKPQQEDIQPFPPTFFDMRTLVRSEQDSRSGLEQAAQGAASASVQSGKHAQQIIEQALVALSGPKAEMESGYQRLCRIVLQLIRMGYTTPQRLKIVGEDGSYKEREWVGSDLGTATDVKIMAGTSTMLAASAKSAIALEKYQAQAITLEDFQRAEEGNVRALIGQQDNPAKTRIKGQISAWNDGPPENWQPVQQQPPGAVDEMGQPLPPVADPADPFADRRAVDQEQAVAMVRHAELARGMSGSKFGSKPPEWQALYLAEYEAMRLAAGVQTLAEQQAAMQAQAQMQADQAAQQSEQQHGQKKELKQQDAENKSVQEQQRANNQMAAGSMNPGVAGNAAP